MNNKIPLKQIAVYIMILAVGLISFSCRTKPMVKDIPVAKAIDKYLYLSEIREVIPNNSSKEDSIILAGTYINQWITKQLLLYNAELNLTEKEKDISKLINDYRTSLLTYRYKQKLLDQKLKFTIQDEELEKYYEKYKFNFTLNHNIVKALYIKLPKNAPGLDKLRKLYKSSKTKDLEELEDYCILNANKFDNFDDEWISSEILIRLLPVEIGDRSKYLKNNAYIETEDDTHLYFVKINDYKLKNNIAPFEYIKGDIEEILRNKKKIEFESQLEKQLRKNAKENNLYTIY